MYYIIVYTDITIRSAQWFLQAIYSALETRNNMVVVLRATQLEIQVALSKDW